MAGGQAFVVPDAAAVLADPGEGALDDPAAGQRLEGVQVIGAPDDLDGELERGLGLGDRPGLDQHLHQAAGHRHAHQDHLAVRAARIRRAGNEQERLALLEAPRADVAAKLADTQECLRLIDHKIDVYRGRVAAGDADRLWAATRSRPVAERYRGAPGRLG